MSLLQYAQRLYSLDTLDPRFTAFARSPPGASTKQTNTPRASPKEVAAVDNGRPKASTTTEAPRPLWNTPEFYLYYLIFLICVPLMFKAVYDVSKPSHPNFSKFSDLLSPGWIPGRLVDNSDDQYSTFRDNVPYMALVLIIHPILRKVYEAITPLKDQSPGKSNSKNTPAHAASPPSSADARMIRRVNFDLYFAVLFLFALHGFSAFKVLLILYTNYILATRMPREYVPAVAWIFNIGILFANELGKGYPYSDIATFFLRWPGDGLEGKLAYNWGSYLDAYGGLVPRWEILFNITVLRLISFDMDYVWSLDRGALSPNEKKQLDPSSLSERERVSTPARHQDYSFRNYLAYVLYSPLYLAGPIITFNDYISQVKYTPKSVTRQRTTLYGIRFLICLLTMELVLHYIYAVAIFKSQPSWSTYTPFQLSMLSYFNLHIIWLKLLLPWRFFRFWALLDGIDPPENMVRCMSDNYSTLAFWRGWHRSFNRWIVRYLYIPLGGSTGSKVRAAINFVAVFMFVALWHDIQLRLLMWGWLVSLFVLPEVVAMLLFPRRNFKGRETLYRWLCGIGAVGNVLMMMVSSLVGFAIGFDGLKGLVTGIVGSYSGLVFLATACAALFVGVQVMFETRAQELRQGIKLNC